MVRLGSLLLAWLLVAPLSGASLSAPVGPYSSERQIAAELNQAKEERRLLSKQLEAVTTKLGDRITRLERELDESRRASMTTAVVLDARLKALTGLFELMLTLVAGFGFTLLGYLVFLSWRLHGTPLRSEETEMPPEPSIDELARRPFDDIPRPTSGHRPA